MIFGLIFIITFIFNAAPSSSYRMYELKIGSRGPSDQLIGQQFVYKRALPLMYATYQDTLYTREKKIITEIVAEDLKLDGTGGVVKIIRNGIGFSNVTLRLRSQFSRGLKYMIRLYGH